MFIKARLAKASEKFIKQIHTQHVETRFSGLYSLLRLSEQPTDLEIEDAINKNIAFIGIPYKPGHEEHVINESFFIKVFHALMHSKDPKILMKMLKVIYFYINCD